MPSKRNSPRRKSTFGDTSHWNPPRLTPWRTWAYNGQVPGPEIRVTEGQRLRVTLENRLPEPTTIHWHGLPVPAEMDGVPDVSQRPVRPGETFTYEFDVPASGTFFYHSHVGLQLDRGLSGPLIVTPRDDGAAPGEDREQVLVLTGRLPRRSSAR